jgi:hypothetical protein
MVSECTLGRRTSECNVRVTSVLKCALHAERIALWATKLLSLSIRSTASQTKFLFRKSLKNSMEWGHVHLLLPWELLCKMPQSFPTDRSSVKCSTADTIFQVLVTRYSAWIRYWIWWMLVTDTQVKVGVTVTLRPTVSLGVKSHLVRKTKFVTVRHLRFCRRGAPSLTRGRVSFTVVIVNSTCHYCLRFCMSAFSIIVKSPVPCGYMLFTILHVTLVYTYLLTHGAERFLRSCQLCSHSRTSQR